MKHIISTDGSTGRIISADGKQIIGTWGPAESAAQSASRTDVVSNQLVQGSQNRISQTATNSVDVSNQVNSLITGTIVGAAGIAGMYAVKPSVKQFVNTATQKKGSDSKKAAPKKSELDFKYSSDVQNPSDVKFVDVSAIIQQTAQTKNTHIGAKEATFIKPDESTTNTESGKQQTTAPIATIGPAPKNYDQKLKAQENEKTLTFKEMNETQLEAVDKDLTRFDGANSLFFAALKKAVQKTRFGKISKYTLTGIQLFNKALLMTIQAPLENELNMNGDTGKAIGHEVATLGTGFLISTIPFVGPPIALLDAGFSVLTGISGIEEGVHLMENAADHIFAGSHKGFEYELAQDWERTEMKTEDLADYIEKLEASIKTTSSSERKSKQIKLLQKLQKHKNEIEARRKKMKEEKPTLNDDRDWSLLNPDFMP
jgi:hypothetical protein